MTKDEALKQALEALEEYHYGEARIILRQALEQPEQEPTCPECKAAVLYECVACSSNNYPPAAQPEQEPVVDKGFPWTQKHVATPQVFGAMPSNILQPPPPLPVQPERPWVGLTELERAEICDLKWWDWEDSFDIEGFARAIEAKLREKNT
jgi:hypothetical protein